MIFITWYTCLISYDTLNGIECLILWERVLLILWELPDYRYNNYDFDSDHESLIHVIAVFKSPAEILRSKSFIPAKPLLWENNAVVFLGMPISILIVHITRIFRTYLLLSSLYLSSDNVWP